VRAIDYPQVLPPSTLDSRLQQTAPTAHDEVQRLYYHSVRAACDRHEVGSGAIYTWRRQAMSGELTGVRPPALPAFSEVEVADPVVRDVAPPAPPHCGQIGIELPTGVRLTVDAMVDADALARVIAVLCR
jgi:transposase